MPIRSMPLVTDEIYHVVNRGVNHQPIFDDARDYQRFLAVVSYYQYARPPTRFSEFTKLIGEEKARIWAQLISESQILITFLAFSLMPNHFHFLLRQEVENGISKFLANIQNSFGKYFNTKYRRTGHLWEGQFRAKLIETDQQLLHTHRYIHLNPYTSYVVKSVDELLSYPYSSLLQYLSGKGGLCETNDILKHFSSIDQYRLFILDQKDYQRTLASIKHLLMEK